MFNCPHCEHELTHQEIVFLYSKLGGLATSVIKTKLSNTNSRNAGRLSFEDVAIIRKSKQPIKELAEKYKVSYYTIRRLKINNKWLSTPNCPHCEHELTPHEIGVLYGTLGGSQRSSRKAKNSAAVGRKAGKLTWVDVNRIRKSKQSTKELAKKYKVDYSTIRMVRVFKTWKPLSPE